MARKKKLTTLLEANVLLAARTLMTEEQLAGGRLPILDQARIMVKAMPKATRVGEFIAHLDDRPCRGTHPQLQDSL